MRRILLVILLLLFCFTGIYAQSTESNLDYGPNAARKLYLSAKVALELGDLIFSDDDEEDTYKANPGFAFSGEIMKKFSDEFYLGAGATMQLDRQLEEDSGSFKYTCYYGVLRADLLLNNISRYLYSFVNLGYSLLNEDKYWTGKDLKGDLYFGIGMGVQVGPVLLEAAYKNFGSYIDSELSDDLTIDVDYRVISFSIGFIS